MKKVLTVLLVIAVMFTFSFGSAFAAPVADNSDANMIKDAAEYVKSDLANAVQKAYDAVLSNGANSYITVAAWEAAAADITKKLGEAVDDEKDAYLAEASTLPTGWNAYDYKYAASVLYDDYDYTDLVTRFSENADVYAVMAAKEQFRIDLADEMKVYDKVDLDALYSKTEPTTGDTYYEQAVKAIDDNKDALNDFYFDKDGDVQGVGTTVSSVKNEIEAVKGWISAGYNGSFKLVAVKAENYDGTSVAKYYYVDGIKTLDDAAIDESLDAATAATIKAQVAKNVAKFLKDNKATSDKDFAEDYAALYNYLADEVPNATNLATAVITHETIMPAVKGSHAAIIAAAIDDIEDLEAYAAKYAAEKDATGALVRDPAEVDKLVNKAKLYTYAQAVGVTDSSIDTYTIATAKAEIAAMTTDGDAAFFAFQKEAKKADLDDLYDDAVENYYDLEAAKLKAAYDAAKAKIDAAEKVEDFASIVTTLNKEVNKIDDCDKVDNLFKGGKMLDELNKQAEALVDYVAYKNSGIKSKTYEDAYIVGGTLTNAKALLTDYYIDNNARTADEMKALTGVVEAVAATLPTNADLTAAKKAAEDAIKALPAVAKVTSADKAAFQAAFDLAEAYNDMAETAGLSDSLAIPAAKINALHDEIQADFQLAYAKADKNDKAALKAIKEAVKAANDEVDDDKLFTVEFTDPTVDDLAKIRQNEKDIVIAAIKAIPLNVTDADKDIVVKARELYDAFVAEYTDYDLGEAQQFSGYVAKEFDAYYHELALAEASLGLNADPEWAAVEALKITAKSTAKKGSITVKWTVKGDASNIDGYEIWKSTKKSSGFYKAFKTTKQTYKNTKDLKAGTRYYYKVRAYKMVDGVKYTSDWSNKAYRVAK